MKYLSKINVFWISLIFICSCSSTKVLKEFPVNGKKNWQLTFEETGIDMPIKDFEKRIFDKNGFIADKWNVESIHRTVKKYGYMSDSRLIIPVENGCENKYIFAKKYLSNVFESDKFVSYKLKSNTATGTRLHPSIVTKVSEKSNESAEQKKGITYEIDSVMTWKYGQVSDPAIGRGVVDFGVSFKCISGSKLVADISINDAKTYNPTFNLIVDQEMADIFIDEEIIDSKLSNLMANSVVTRDGNKALSAIYGEITSNIRNRYVQKNVEKMALSTKIVPVEHNVLVSRFQRKLTNYIFDSRTSSFYYDTEIKKGDAKAPIRIVLNLYPEANGSTAIESFIQYTPVFDNFKNELAIGSDDAKRVGDTYSGKFREIIGKA